MKRGVRLSGLFFIHICIWQSSSEMALLPNTFYNLAHVRVHSLRSSHHRCLGPPQFQFPIFPTSCGLWLAAGTIFTAVTRPLKQSGVSPSATSLASSSLGLNPTIALDLKESRSARHFSTASTREGLISPTGPGGIADVQA